MKCIRQFSYVNGDFLGVLDSISQGIRIVTACIPFGERLELSVISLRYLACMMCHGRMHFYQFSCRKNKTGSDYFCL